MIFEAVIVVYLVILTVNFLTLKKHYSRLIEVSKKENLIDVLNTILDKLKDHKNNLDSLKNDLNYLAKKGHTYIQHVGIVKFNPFSDTGGDQSFVMSLLDGGDNGIVLTSLHNRSTTRWYVKYVKGGKGVDYQLSEEEKRAIKTAGKQGGI